MSKAGPDSSYFAVMAYDPLGRLPQQPSSVAAAAAAYYIRECLLLPQGRYIENLYSYPFL